MATAALGFDKPISVISNGVDTYRFSPGKPNEDLRRELGLDNRPIVLYTGRLDSEKQMDVWLRAAAETSRLVNAQFVVGGQGTERSTLETLASELGLSDRIRFVGYLTDERFPDLYRLADVFFITSPVELQSISTLEAVASGLPVVAVRSGALPELVEQGQNGYLVAPGDWKCAAQVLATLLGNTELNREFGKRSRETALRHGLDATIDSYEHFLCRGENGRRGAGRHEQLAAVEC
jgi:1,2-diacylglycerol 3-alpha-glucosyltransferase